MQTYAKLPIIGNRALLEKANQLEKVWKKVQNIGDVLGHFINVEYIYQQQADHEVF